MLKFRQSMLSLLVAASVGVAVPAAFAQTSGASAASATQSGQGDHEGRMARMKERFEKHQAELHNKLMLNAPQEQAWQAWVGRMRPGAHPATPSRADIEKMTAPEHMERRHAMMQQAEKRMAERVAATKEFYAQLTPEQQKIFNESFPRGPKHGRMHRG